jgi:hypothetical protein
MSNTSFLKSFDSSMLATYYNGAFTPPDPDTLSWVPLGEVGSHQINIQDFNNTVD